MCSDENCLKTSTIELVDQETGLCTDCLVSRMVDLVNEMVGNPFEDEHRRELAARTVSLLESVPDIIVAKALEFKPKS